MFFFTESKGSSEKHKVFVSFHHDNDQRYADELRRQYGDNSTFIDKSLEEAYPDTWSDEKILADIRQNHLRDSTVTIILIGAETSKRKWVDWEINASLRPYGSRTRNGLLGIYLPTAGDVPARLQDNIDSGYAATMNWYEVALKLNNKIEEAFENRDYTFLIENSRDLKVHNGW